MNKRDIEITDVTLFFLPVETRMPLKFGAETLTYAVCARCRVTVRSEDGKTAQGWGETPLSVPWVWPSALPYQDRMDVLKQFTRRIAGKFRDFPGKGHPMEIGWDFQEQILKQELREFNKNERDGQEPLPYLGALVCCSPLDSALHDAYGIINGLPVYETYRAPYMNRDLSAYLEDASLFRDKFPADYFDTPKEGTTLPAWHLVGGKDPLDKSELTGNEPDDGYPVLLEDWIKTDGLRCLKIKLTGTDREWDIRRLEKAGRIGSSLGVLWLTADFNCQVQDPSYVTGILDLFKEEYPRIYQMLLYVEQPFPYELAEHPLDVHSVSARKPLFMDESAHDWKLVKYGFGLGWTGVALKTCKTQTGALLSLCWAKQRGMTLMVQDLTNPMIAQIPHVLLAWHAGTIMGVETNSMQFYPDASVPESKVHPGLYRRKDGTVDVKTALEFPGFGLRIDEIKRELPAEEQI
ncbi:MAG: enolase C-terminal domain-like protein [Spirochaetia bacterium]